MGLTIPSVPEVDAAAVWSYATRLLTSLQDPTHLQKYLGGPAGALGTVLPSNKSLYDILTDNFGALPGGESLYKLIVLDRLNIMEHEIEFPSAEALDDIAAIGEQTTTERGITVALPTGATRRRVLLLAVITAMNNTATPQKVDITVQGRKGAGAFSNFFSQDDIIGFGAVDGATTGIITLQDVSALVDEAAVYGFRLSVNQSAANSVRYTTQYLLVITYRMS